MDNKGTILVCDSDAAILEQLQQGLQEYDIDVDILKDASELVSQAIRTKPTVIIANPDMPGFNAPDVCKHLKKDLDIPIVLLFEPHSTSRNTIDECSADDEITKPLDIGNIASLIQKHIVFDQ